MIHKFYLSDLKGFDVEPNARQLTYCVPSWDAPNSDFIMHIYATPDMYKGFIYDQARVISAVKQGDMMRYVVQYNKVRFSGIADMRQAKIDSIL